MCLSRKLDPIQEIGPKVGGAWALFQGWVLFRATMVCLLGVLMAVFHLATEYELALLHFLILTGSLVMHMMKQPATYTRHFPLWMQLLPAPQSPFSFHLGCGYARKKKNNTIVMVGYLCLQSLPEWA